MTSRSRIVLAAALCVARWPTAEAQSLEELYQDFYALAYKNAQLNAAAREAYLQEEESVPINERHAPYYYMDYPETEAWLHHVVDAASIHSHAKLVKIGESFLGRNIWLIEVNRYRFDLPAIWIDAGIHAGEHIGHATMIYIINKIFFGDCSCLRDNYRMYLLPVINPDGYEYSLKENRIWRGNLQPNPPGAPCNFGTDINRNFDANFTDACRRNNNPCSFFYAGPEPFSAPEAQVLRDALIKRSNIHMYISLHAYGQFFIYPTEQEAGTERFQEMTRVASIAADAVKAVNGSNFAFGDLASTIQYCTPGSVSEWAFHELDIPYTYTIELRPPIHPEFAGDIAEPVPQKFLFPFVLPPDQIYPSGEEIFAGIEAAVKAINATKRLHVRKASNQLGGALAAVDIVLEGDAFAEGETLAFDALAEVGAFREGGTSAGVDAFVEGGAFAEVGAFAGGGEAAGAPGGDPGGAGAGGRLP